MPRPSQCPACGCFEFCLFPQEEDCAERVEYELIKRNRGDDDSTS